MQGPTDLFSTEAEYYASIDTCKAGLHIQVILYEIQFGKISIEDDLPPLQMLLDNQSTIHLLETHQIRNSSKQCSLSCNIINYNTIF